MNEALHSYVLVSLVFFGQTLEHPKKKKKKGKNKFLTFIAIIVVGVQNISQCRPYKHYRFLDTV